LVSLWQNVITTLRKNRDSLDPLFFHDYHSFLGEGTPQEKVQDALLFASQVGYPLADLSLLKDLYDGVEHWTPSTKVPSS